MRRAGAAGAAPIAAQPRRAGAARRRGGSAKRALVIEVAPCCVGQQSIKEACMQGASSPGIVKIGQCMLTCFQ